MGLFHWNQDKFGPGWAYIVTAFHAAVLFSAAWLFYSYYVQGIQAGETKKNEPASNVAVVVCSKAIVSDVACKLGLAVLFGGIGGALIASRYVVRAVRWHTYDSRRILWQITTPFHSAILAGVGFFIVRAGLVTLSASPSVKEPEYTYFVIGFSFLVGIASESFIQRLMKTAKTLFGEESKQEEDQRSAREARGGTVTEAEHGKASETGSPA